jgi:hypothetical protein
VLEEARRRTASVVLSRPHHTDLSACPLVSESLPLRGTRCASFACCAIPPPRYYRFPRTAATSAAVAAETYSFVVALVGCSGLIARLSPPQRDQC